VLSERLAGGRYVATVEGLAGRTYAYRLRTPDRAWHDASITFPRAGANADGFVTATLTP
jgi:hypothetical protein